jgi:hypothetical protein
MADLIPMERGASAPPVLDGEILPPERSSTVTLQPHPFSQSHVRFEIAEGSTIYGIVIAGGLRPSILKHVRVWIGDEEIPQDVWHLVRPKAGTQVFIKLTPKGGGGGNFLRTMLMLAVVVAATLVAGPAGGAIAGTLGLSAMAGAAIGSLIATGLTTLGLYLINMLVPPPKAGGKTSERALLGAIRNRFNPFGPVPRIIGRRRVWPVLAARPYTESQGGKRYLRAMLLVGFGPLRISDIRIGETPISVYSNIEIEVREGWYNETFGNFKLTADNRWDFATTAESWAATNASLSVINGALRITASASDPMITRSGLSINGQRDTIVRIKARRIAGTGWDGTCRYSTAGHGYSASFQRTIANPFVRNGEWIIVEWDMSALTAGGNDWRENTVTGLRIDLGSASDTIFEIEWIEVGFPCGRDRPRDLYSRSIAQLDVSAKLNSNAVVIRTTDPDSIGFGVDVQFPGGLGRADRDDPGKINNETVSVDVRYRRVGTTAWLTPTWSSRVSLDGTATNGELTYTAKTPSEVVAGGWASFPVKGQYEIQLIRSTADFVDSRSFGDSYWQTLRSIKDTPAVNDELVGGLATISIRAKATDQFQSFPDQINCIAESYLPVPNAAGSWTYEVTRNPAWSFTDVLRHRGRERLMEDSRLDMTAIREWAVACDQTAPGTSRPYWQVDAQLEDGSLFDNCREIASHARASFMVNSGLYSVVRDVAQTVPVQLITPKNSWGYSGMRQFIDLPHALRINFVNADKNWREDERIVYADGYSKDNATRFETLDYPYCTDADQVFREARYQMAVGSLRPDQHMVSMDIESLRCTLGDYVMLAHDVLSIGTGVGRVIAVTGTTTITAIQLNERVTLDSARTYAIRYRRGADSAIYTAQLAAVMEPGEYDVLTLSAGLASAIAPAVGDLVAVGEFGVETAPMLVKRIEPGPDMTATLTLVDAQPGVWTADQAEIPAFNSFVSEDVEVSQKRPAPPSFRLVSDEQALVRLSDGSLPDQIMVIIGAPAASVLAVSDFQMQWRSSPEDGDEEYGSPVTTPIGKNVLYISPVRAGSQYDVRVRSVSEFGVASEWVEILNHTVVGKTTPPAQVQGFTAVSGIEGVQLSWEPNAEPDLKGYIVKRGNTWETAELVSEVLTGTSIFVKTDTSRAQNFIIRATDVVGNSSQTNAEAQAAAVFPDPVANLEGFVQGDIVFLRWSPVSMVGVRYEVREGADWKTARFVGTVSNEDIRTRLPTTEAASRAFWVESISSLGVYSGTPRSVQLTVLPLENQNVVMDLDLVVLDFPGVKLDVTQLGDTLSLDLDGSGTQFPRGEYTHQIDLGAEYSVRCWVDASASAIAGAGQTWESSSFSWASAESRTWLGFLSENRAGDVTPRISIDSGFDADLVEGWRWNNSANGNKLSTAPSVNTGMTFNSDVRFDKGASFSRLSKLAYTVSVPSTFSIAIDVRMRSAGPNDGLIFRLVGSGITLWCCINQTENVIALFDHLGNLNMVSYADAVNDVATIIVTQSPTERGLHVGSRRAKPVVSDVQPFVALGAFTSIAFHE